MDHNPRHLPQHSPQAPPFWRSRFGIGWIVLAAVAGWFLWAEHRAHLLGFLPFAILLACPLMHVFMHRGHGHGHGHGGGQHSKRDERSERERP